MRDLLEEIGTTDKKVFLSGKRDLLSELEEKPRKRGGVTRSFALSPTEYIRKNIAGVPREAAALAETMGRFATGAALWPVELGARLGGVAGGVAGGQLVSERKKPFKTVVEEAEARVGKVLGMGEPWLPETRRNLKYIGQYLQLPKRIAQWSSDQIKKVFPILEELDRKAVPKSDWGKVLGYAINEGTDLASAIIALGGAGVTIREGYGRLTGRPKPLSLEPQFRDVERLREQERLDVLEEKRIAEMEAKETAVSETMAKWREPMPPTLPPGQGFELVEKPRDLLAELEKAPIKEVKKIVPEVPVEEKAVLEIPAEREIPIERRDILAELKEEEIKPFAPEIIKERVTPEAPPGAQVTTKSIGSLKQGESTVLSIDDVEYKLLESLDKTQYTVKPIDKFSVMVTREAKAKPEVPEPTIKEPSEPIVPITEPRAAVDIIKDINIAFGEKGVIGKQEITEVMRAARERLIQDIESMRAEASRTGKALIEIMKDHGIDQDTAKKLLVFAKPEEEIRVTGIKAAETLRAREIRGLFDIEREAIKGYGRKTFDEGKRIVDSGERDPRILSKQIKETPRAITDEEATMLLYDRMKLQNEHRVTMGTIEKAMDSNDTIAEAEARARLYEIEENLSTNEFASVRSGTAWGRSGVIRQLMIKEDYSLARMIQRVKVDSGGKPIPSELREKFKSLSKQFEEATAKLKEYEEKASVREASKVIRRIENEAAYEQRKTRRTYAKSELDIEFKGLANELNSVLGGIYMGVDPTAALILGKMAKNRVKSGIVTVEGLVDAIYTEVKNLGIELSKRDIRDAISGYGKTVHMSKEEINVQMRELKHQMRLISAYEDATAGMIPLRSGLQRDIMSDKVRELGRRVKQAMRESGIDVTKTRTPEDQWKTSLDAVKTRLKNQIRDITKQLKTGEKTPKRIGIQYDAEALSLKEQRDALKAQLEQIEGKPEMSAEQRIKVATAAVERSITEYERRIAEKDLIPRKRGVITPETFELKALRTRRDELKKVYQDIVKEARPRKTPEEIALQSFKTRTTNKIVEYEERLAVGDFVTKPKREIKLDPEAIKLKFQIEKVKSAYNKARFKYQMSLRTPFQRVGAGVVEALNLSRAIKTSIDLSAVLRQGAFVVLGHPIRGIKAMPSMFKALLSKEGQFAVEQEILQRPNYPLYEKSGLYLAEHGQKLSQMEEVYMSRLAEKIPGVAASQRAYTTYLNRLRADSFDAMVKTLAVREKPTPVEAKAIANFVNVATGRGSLGMKEGALVGLNTVFFAPRYVLSRFQILAAQPFYRGTIRSRAIIAKEYARFLTGLAVVYSLGLLADGNVEVDPRSSDFGKIRFGKTRVDPLAGLSQTATLVSRLVTGETKTLRGKIRPLRGEKVSFGGGDSADVIARFLRTKLSPVVGTGVDILAKRDVVGEKVTISRIPGKLLAPLALNDIYDAMIEEGVPAGTALAVLAIFGMGLQTYGNRGRRQ